MTSFCVNVSRGVDEHASAAVIVAATTHATKPFTAGDYTAAVRVLGIDYGTKRIGLALSDATGTLASPWRMIERPSSEAATLRLMIEQIEQLTTEADGLAAVVVGWPRRLDGTATHQTPTVEAFARAL